MNELLSKIQYKNFETGEFIEVKKRNLTDTIALIESFPWEIQREKNVINLTNPSITIEGKNNEYLKLAPFYNNKFVLHYFSEVQILYTKSFYNLADGYKYISNYFNSATFDTTDFKHENTWLQHNLKHFVSQDFKYVLSSQSVARYVWSTSSISFAFSIFFILFFTIKGFGHIHGAVFLLIGPVMFYMGGGLNLILIFNYYFYAKDKILIMSKGNDVFFYGNKLAPLKYDKKNITKYRVIESGSSKSPVSNFGLVKINFNEGEEIIIPNIFVDIYTLDNKLSGYTKIEKNGFPFIKAGNRRL